MVFFLDVLQIQAIPTIQPYMMTHLYGESKGVIVPPLHYSNLKNSKPHSLRHIIRMFLPEKI